MDTKREAPTSGRRDPPRRPISALFGERRRLAPHALAAGLLLATLVAVAGRSESIGHPLGNMVVALAGARQLWLWAAGGGFAAALLCSAGAWRSALASCGSRIGRLDTVARYSVGSLVNSLLPAHAGGAARIALFSQTIGSELRIWTAGGVAAAIGVARGLVLGLLVLVAWATGALPLWPVLALAALGAGAVIICLAVRRRRPGGRLSHLLDAFRAFGRSPRDASSLLAWVAASSAARVAAAAAVAAALGVGAPLTAALIVVPALALAGVVQVTPANVGAAGATVAFALQSKGVALTSALAGGLLFQAIETAVGLGLGLAGAAFLAFPSAAGRRWTIAAAGGCACLLSIAFGATALDTLS